MGRRVEVVAEERTVIYVLKRIVEKLKYRKSGYFYVARYTGSKISVEKYKITRSTNKVIRSDDFSIMRNEMDHPSTKLLHEVHSFDRSVAILTLLTHLKKEVSYYKSTRTMYCKKIEKAIREFMEG